MDMDGVKKASVSYQHGTERAKVPVEKAPAGKELQVKSAEKESVQKRMDKEDGISVANEHNNAQQAVNNTQIRKAVDDINKKAWNSEAIFGIHDPTNRVMIKIVDKDSKEVIKEYPPERTLDMIAKVWEVAGLLIDEKM